MIFILPCFTLKIVRLLEDVKTHASRYYRRNGAKASKGMYPFQIDNGPPMF